MQPEQNLVAEPPHQHDAPAEDWVHVSLPDAVTLERAAAAAVADNDGVVGPPPAASQHVTTPPFPFSRDSMPSCDNDVGYQLTFTCSMVTQAPSPVASPTAAAALALRSAATASGELLFDFDGGSQAASPAKADASALGAAAAVDEVRAQHDALRRSKVRSGL